jgi:hypothetical protein
LLKLGHVRDRLIGTDRRDTKEAYMYTIALTTVLFHSLVTVAMVLGSALTACLPDRPTRS